MTEKFTIAIRRFIINKMIDETEEQRLTKHNYSLRMKDSQPEIMGISLPEEAKSHYEQKVKQEYILRVNNSLNLAKKLKLIKDIIVPSTVGGHDIFVHLYITTRRGRFYRRLPFLVQSAVIYTSLFLNKFIITTTKYKWLFGIVSFATLSAKVWNSGVIDKAWIGISALCGLLIVGLLSIWS